MSGDPQGKRLIKLRGESIPADAHFKYMNGRERMGHPFKFELVFDCKNVALKPADVLDKQLTISLESAKGEEQRQFSGIVTRFSILESRAVLPRFSGHERYIAVIRPRLWRLTGVSHCRFFHDLTVLQIATQLLDQYGVRYDIKIKRTDDYPKLDHCVQYRETDFDFLNRLLQREGIYYYFEHRNEQDIMVLADNPADHEPILDGGTEIPYGISLSRTLGEKITQWRGDHRIVTDLSKVSAFDFTNATLNSSPATYAEAGDKATKNPYAVEDYALRYLSVGGNDNGRRLAQVRLDECCARGMMAAGECNVGKMWPGGWFRMFGHPRADQNAEYLVTEADYELRMDGESRFSQPFAEMKYRHWTEAWVTRWIKWRVALRYLKKTTVGPQDPNWLRESESEPLFRCTFRAIPRNQPFRTEYWAPIPSVGPQTAIVVTSSGDDFSTDSYGRIKVQFHWEQFNPPASDKRMQRCWVRVAQPWAGNRWGAMFLPRSGQEVLVDFLGGDPDNPVVVGGLYNSSNPTPYTLPAAGAVSTLRTQSVGDKKSEHNELRFNDKDLQVLLYTDGRYDNYVAKDRYCFVGKDSHTIVGKRQLVKVNTQHVTVESSQNTKAYDVSLSATTSIIHQSGDKYVIRSGIVHLKSTEEVVLESMGRITLKVGGSSVVVGPEGVHIDGPMVYLNSGSSAEGGPGGKPSSPDEPEKADNGSSVT